MVIPGVVVVDVVVVVVVDCGYLIVVVVVVVVLCVVVVAAVVCWVPSVAVAVLLLAISLLGKPATVSPSSTPSSSSVPACPRIPAKSQPDLLTDTAVQPQRKHSGLVQNVEILEWSRT